jgi:ADP-heptose:LPS heptosyltransferase|tara:strand:+ start:1943 stop:2992 length:1050 start_codon:yes stop_codon:yes gene_type:complete
MIGTDKIKIFYVKFLVFYRLMFIKIIRHIIFKKHDYKKSTKILINRDGAFGDSIVAIPSISVIRQNFPSAQIDLLTFSDHGITFSDIELKDNLVNNILVKNKKNRFITLTNLKKNKYDLFIQLPQNLGLYKSLRNMIIVRFFIGIKSAFGWDSGRIKSFIKTQKKYLTIPTETQRLLNNLKTEGLMGKTSYPIEIKIPHEKTVIDLLKRKVAVFIIGGKLKIKKWPLKNWVNLANLIGEDYEIIIIGGPSEIEEAKYIKSRTKNSYNFCNKFSISELFFVFKNSQIAISNDTGAMHLCDAAGTIVIGLFSTKELSPKWYPNNKKAIVIEDNDSITNISPTKVYNVIKSF